MIGRNGSGISRGPGFSCGPNPFSNDAGGDSGDNGAGRHVARNHCAGRHDCQSADLGGADDRRISRHPGSGTDDDVTALARDGGLPQLLRRRDFVGAGQQADILTKECIILHLMCPDITLNSALLIRAERAMETRAGSAMMSLNTRCPRMCVSRNRPYSGIV